jgi:hypothetical protein
MPEVLLVDFIQPIVFKAVTIRVIAIQNKVMYKLKRYWNRLGFLLFLLLPFGIYAQDGPASIGNADGSHGQPELVLWLKADAGIAYDGSNNITLWEDQSGHANHATPPAVTNQPLFVADGGSLFNNQPVVRFANGNNDYFKIQDAANLDNTKELTVIAVFMANNFSGDRGFISKRTGVGVQQSYVFWNNGSTLMSRTNNDNIASNVLVSGTSYIRTSVYNGNLATGELWHYLNTDVAPLAVSGNIANSIPNNASPLIIGTFHEGDNRNFQGDVAEVIIYRTALNSAQKNIIENYLNEKYGIPASLDVFTGNDAAYTYDVTGIGQETDGTQMASASAGMGITINSGFNNGDYVAMAHNNAVNDTLNINVSADVAAAGAEAAWNRNWYLEKTGNGDVRISFDIKNGIEGGEYPVGAANYTLLYRAGTSGNYAQVNATAQGVEKGSKVYFDVSGANLNNGYYTLGTLDQATSPVQGTPGLSWYTLVSGDWDDWETWTLDPSGALPDNPGNYTPTTSPTSNADKVFVLSGRTVAIQPGNNNKAHAQVWVHGRLDLTTTTGHSFGTISGSGRILMQADNFPLGDASHFVSKGLGEGTAVFYGTGLSLSTSRTFYNVEVDFENTANTLTLLNDLTINGNLQVEKGTIRINDNTNTTDLDIGVAGNIAVSADGAIATGTANARHSLSLHGDLVNYGTIHFTNLATAEYTADVTNGIVDLKALNGSSNQQIQCNGYTRFYRIEIDKGIDETYALSITASNPGNFALFGNAEEGHGSTAQLSSNANALGLIRGTVKIGVNVDIPVLNVGGNYNISEAACLWVDGGSVTKPTGTAIVPYGKIRVTGGSLNAPVNSGITLRENGQINISGGSITTNQIRTSVLGSSHIGGYIQSGGTVTITGGNTNADYYCFNLTFEGNVFQMTGGILHIEESNGNGGFLINSDPSNVHVTGGTVIFEIDDNQDFDITSRAPLWNVVMRNSDNDGEKFILGPAINIGSTNVNVAAQPLKVLNNLTLEQDIHFDTQNEDVYIGRDFTIGDGALYEFHTNTTHFNGTSSGTLFIGNIRGLSNPSYTDPEGADPYNNWENPFYGFTIDKPAGQTLTLATGCTYDAGNTSVFESGGCKNINDWANNLIKVTGPFVLESGQFDIDVFSARLYDEITNKGICALDAVPENAYIKTREESSATTRTVTTADGAVFGNLRLNVGEGLLAFTSDVYIKRLQYRHGRIYIGPHNLKIDELFMDLSPGETVGGNPSVQDMIITDGNPSDGGLTLFMPAGGSKLSGADHYDANDLGFPLGVGTTGVEPTSKFTEVRIRHMVPSSEDGYITVVPVNKPNSKMNGGTNDALQYYWTLKHDYALDTPTVRIRGWYHSTDINGNENNYVPGRVIRTSVRDIPSGDVNTTAHRVRFMDVNPWPGDYTAGITSKFAGAVTVYYSRLPNGSSWYNRYWEDGNNWSLVPHDNATNNDAREAAGTWPQTGDIAVIGYGGYDGSGTTFHSINIANGDDIDVAEIIFNNPFTNSNRLVIHRNASLSFGLIGGTGGTFMQRLRPADIQNISGDFGGFYSKNAFTYAYFLDANGTYNINPPTLIFPNLRVEGGNNNRIAVFQEDILVNNNFVVDGNTVVRTNNGANGDIDVRGQLYIGGYLGGNFEFNDGAARTVKVGGLWFRGSSETSNVTVRNNNQNGLEHTLVVNGNIVQERPGDFILFNGNGINDNNAVLELSGDGNHLYNQTNGNTPSFYRMVVNKGNNQENSFTFPNFFTLNGPTDGAGVLKALELQNGSLVLNSAALNINLSTGDDDFRIPSSSALVIQLGQVNVSGGSGILLDGKLELNNGTIDMSGGDNYIEYSASNNATLNINGGSLTVGSQIRRGLGSDIGILKYTQTGGNVIIGSDAAPRNNRALFEVLGTGSSFSFTGGNFYIVRRQNAPTIASLYLDPGNYSIALGSTINLGHSSSPASQEIGVYSAIPLKNLRINNESGNNVSAKLWVVPLTLEEDLTIDAGSSLDADGKNIFLKGDWINGGSFVPNGNTVTFNGSADQTINGNTQFHNFEKTNNNLLALNAGNTEINIANELNVAAGTVQDNGNTMAVGGYCHFNGTHLFGGTGKGIHLKGSYQQELSGDGTFGKLTINNANGILVPLGNEITITDTLEMRQGVFYIGKNLLTIGLNGNIKEASTYSGTNMIQTNISFTDNGVKKIFPSGASGFVFPIGSSGKYTPFSLNISANDNNTGSITVKGANEMHPSIIDDDESPDPSIVDADNVLQYYWVLKSEGISGFDATGTMQGQESDVKVTAPYDTTYYITARLLADGSGLWNKFDETTFMGGSNTLQFTFNGVDDASISGDYTAGVDGAAFNGAIPNMVPEYVSATSGNWSDQTTWSPNIAGGPRGSITVIGAAHTVTLTSNYVSSYSTEINGQVNVGTTFGHRFGLVTGNGTVQLQRGEIPAGVYGDFFASGGGTLIFAGTTDYDILGGISNVNHMTLSGSGERRLPNSKLLLNGDLAIDGADLINEYDQEIEMKGDMALLSGTFEAGSGTSAIVHMSGTAVQNISGNFTGSNGFNILKVNNANGLTLSGNIDIEKRLDLLNGTINTGANNLTIKYNATINPSTGSMSSYINGKLVKEMLSGNSFTFPIGDGADRGNIQLMGVSGFSGIDNFSARYHFENPTVAGMDATQYAAPAQAVSQTEYWDIQAPAGAQSALRITLDGSSDIASAMSDLADLRIMGWSTVNSRWEVVGTSTTYTGNAANGSLTTTGNVNFNNYRYFTIGSIEALVLGTATIISADASICAGENYNLIIAVTGTANWTVQYSDGTNTFTENISTSPHTVTLAPSATTSYTLTSVTDGNGPGNLVGNTDVDVDLKPSPTASLVHDAIGNTLCEDDEVEFTAAGGSHFDFQVNGTSEQASASASFVTVALENNDEVFVVVTGSNGCSDTSAIETFVVNPLPAGTLTIDDADSTICFGETITFTATDGDNYNFLVNSISRQNGAAAVYAPADLPLGNNTIGVEVTNAGTCTSTYNAFQVQVNDVPDTGDMYRTPNK